MTAVILKVTPSEAWDLIFFDHLSMLSPIDQETMNRALHNSSHIWLGCDNHKVLAIWGLIPPTLLSDRAYLWLYTTENLTSHQFMFIRHSQRAVKEMLEQYPLIVGNTLLSNSRAIRWLKWLGAEFIPTDNPVLYFEIKKSWQPQLVQSA
jgi:hypothetical protein